MPKPNHDTTESEELPEELVITLRKPIILGGETYDTMTLREPEAGQIDKVSKTAAGNAYGSNLQLIELVSGLPRPVVNKIGVRDVNKALAYLLGFMPEGRETGNPS
jgi:hypothetical protein